MENSLSNKYFLQAYEAFFYDLPEALEALGYAISYEPEHAGAHCLLGQLHFEHTKQYEKAKFHFEKALASDMNYTETYYHYSNLLIGMAEYDKAKVVIDFALKVPGINKSRVLFLDGLISEYQYKFAIAKKKMKEAHKLSCVEWEREYLKNQLSRIKAKTTSSNKNKKKKKKKTSVKK